eukprot:5769306-Pyramimonas_sp.AAC.1
MSLQRHACNVMLCALLRESCAGSKAMQVESCGSPRGIPPPTAHAPSHYSRQVCSVLTNAQR